MANPTGFTTSANNYSNNTDLSSIFAPQFPCNTDYGTLAFNASNPSTTAYVNMNNTNSNSFTKTSNNNIVNVGLNGNGSYFEFTKSGIYNLTFSYKLNDITSSSGNVPTSYTRIMNMRFHNTNTTSFDEINNLVYYYVEHNGNGATAYSGNITSDSPNNQIWMYYPGSNSNSGYPVYQSSFYSNVADTTVTPAVNCYSVLITFKIEANVKIFPQYYMNSTSSNLTWSWSGNWSITKLYELGSINLSNTNYAVNQTDLRSIFASIYPLNIDYGLLTMYKINPYSTTDYSPMNNGSITSFNKESNNGIVTTGADNLNDVIHSYFEFPQSNTGIYNLTISYSLDNILNSSSNVGGTITPIMYMRLNNEPILTFSNNISFNFSNFINLANNGNSVDSTTSSGVVSLCDNNLVKMYRKDVGYLGGYAVFESQYYFSSIIASGASYPRKNLFTLSITFKPPTTNPSRIYPQYYISNVTNSNYTWTWNGNWMVTKLSG